MLPEIPNVTVIRQGITRILGQNPGPFTLQGTNTYLIATEKRSVLLDTGEGKFGYLGYLESVLKSSPPVSDIILSHWHRDHVGGLPSVLELINKLQNSNSLTSCPNAGTDRFKLPNVWKFKSSATSSLDRLDDHHDQKSQVPMVKHDQEICQQILKSFHDCVSNEQETTHASKTSRDAQPPIEAQSQLSWLSDRQVFELCPDLRLEILHTPGHTDDSICCLLYEGEKKDNKSELSRVEQPTAVFVGDTILGGSSTIFEDLVVYLKSLEKLLEVINSKNHPSSDCDATTSLKIVPLYSAHGPIIHNGAQSIHQFITHRLNREKQIIQIFHRHNLLPLVSDHYLTAQNLVELIYQPDLPKEVYPAALHGINQHLKKLKHDGIINQLESDPQFWFLKTSIQVP